MVQLGTRYDQLTNKKKKKKGLTKKLTENVYKLQQEFTCLNRKSQYHKDKFLHEVSLLLPDCSFTVNGVLQHDITPLKDKNTQKSFKQFHVFVRTF